VCVAAGILEDLIAGVHHPTLTVEASIAEGSVGRRPT
jgi:hypothetical protein